MSYPMCTMTSFIISTEKVNMNCSDKIVTILKCLINRIYYGSPILLLSFYCLTEEQFPFLM